MFKDPTPERNYQRALERQLAYQTEKAKRFKSDNFNPDARGFKYAQMVRAKIEQFKGISPSSQVLEVGSGAHGLIFFMNIPHAIGVDPLADEYKKLFPRWQGRVNTIKAEGENLPFHDHKFDLVLSDNVVDHAAYPNKIISEIHRVLKPNGILYFTVHIHHPIYHWLAKCYSIYKFFGLPFEVTPFADHTHHFTLVTARKLFKSDQWNILSESDNIRTTLLQTRKPKRHHIWDWIKCVFFKNATYEVIGQPIKQ